MALTAHYYTQFETHRFYHVYNRSVDRKPMFKNDGNYEFFLRQSDKYLSGYVDTYAYCLIGNHFHLLIGIKDFPFKKDPTHTKTIHDSVSHQFKKFFQSYAMAFNKQHQRIGTLFQTPFKRALVDSDEYFTRLVYYIHANPQTHQIVADYKDWKWSSYHRLLIDKQSKLKKEEVLSWFGDKNAFLKFHNANPSSDFTDDLFIDEI
jgi:REP element-mobilizing transposase RayT